MSNGGLRIVPGWERLRPILYIPDKTSETAVEDPSSWYMKMTILHQQTNLVLLPSQM